MTDKLELKATIEVSDAGAITGLAWPFGTPDRMGDMIEPGAFKGIGGPVPMLFGHDPSDPVGVWSEAREDKVGLKLKGRLLVDDMERAREVRALVKAGAVTGLSIGFVTKRAEARKGGGRTIKQLELVEVSLVTIPMHPGARVTGVKSGSAALSLAAAIQRAAAAIRGA